MRTHSVMTSALLATTVLALAGLIPWSTNALAETSREVEITSVSGGAALPGTLFLPDSSDPKPAVIVLAPGGGRPEPADEGYARELAKKGYVALSVSYQVNGGPSKGPASWSPRITSDLLGVVKWLRELPEVAGRPVGTVGFSAGSHGLLLGARTPAVRAMVIYYGGYNIRKFARDGQNMPQTTRIPIDAAPEIFGAALLLHGEKDDEISVQDAIETRDAMKAAGKTVELVIYPGAYHRFDRGDNGGGARRGFTYEEDPSATSDAFERTLAWFDKYLNSPLPGAATAGPAGDGEPVGPTGLTPSQVLAATDRDKDGKLSRSEFKGPPTAFDNIDANKDGFLTKQELINAYSKR